MSGVTVDRAALVAAFTEVERSQLDANHAVNKATQALIAAEATQRQVNAAADALRAILQAMPDEVTA